MHLCLLRCSGFEFHLCLLDLGTGVWSVCVFWVKLQSVCSEHSHSSCWLLWCTCPNQGEEQSPGEVTNQPSSMALQLLAGERDSVQAVCGIPQESMMDFFEKALISGLSLNFGFALWTTIWAVGAGGTWDTPTAPLSAPAPLLLKLQQATSNCTVSLATHSLNLPGFAEKINILHSQHDYNLCWHRTGSVLVPAASRLSGKEGLCNSS